MTAQGPDDLPFQHYSLKHRVVAWISQNLLDSVTYTVNHGLLKGMRRRGGLAWLPEFVVRDETPEISFWKNQNLKDLVIYDIGAFHGLLTMFFARRAKQVISYEPNTANRARLNENLRLNRISNVSVRTVGLGSKSETVTMFVSPLMPGGASVTPHMIEGLQHSKGRVLSEQISVRTLDDDIREMSLPAPDFVKVDVEGQELAVLLGARQTLVTNHPQLFLEMHGETLNLKRKAVAEIVSCLKEFGYSDIRHVESGSAISPENSSVAAQGHLYCV